MDEKSMDEKGFAKAIGKLKSLNAKRVFVQYPEGIKLRIQSIAKKLEAEGFDAVVCLQECFGACDIRDDEARRLGCDAILHIGHEDYGVKSAMPVVFWEYFIGSDPLPVIEKHFDKLEQYEKIGLVTSIQFVDAIGKIKEFLEQHGKKVYVHKALQHPGQVLGCNLDAATKIEKDVDCFLCVSAGKFYGLGLVMKTGKPMLCLDLEQKKIYDLNDFRRKVQKTIAWNRAQLEDAKTVGILVSWKRGQLYGQLKSPFELKKKLENKGKTVYIFAMDEIMPDKLMGLELDFLINSGCVRIGLDDISRYKIPMLNVDEISSLID